MQPLAESDGRGVYGVARGSIDSRRLWTLKEPGLREELAVGRA